MYQLSMYVKIVEYSKKTENCAAKQSNREEKSHHNQNSQTKEFSIFNEQYRCTVYINDVVYCIGHSNILHIIFFSSSLLQSLRFIISCYCIQINVMCVLMFEYI